ncbi:MAG: peptidyl-prolyl cis-trans isomerase [Pseudomonadales bacterium]|nr:peptidyl-prolyl cis-trans isomerase [Pseudomonadales bacterium]
MKTVLKEPLLHFLLLGAALFLIYALTAGTTGEGDSIDLSEAKITQLRFAFEKTRQRQPSEEELQALILNELKQRVAYKKAVEMGLLEGDNIVQKRLQQKLEFIVEDAVSTLLPSDKELTEFLLAHNEDYRSDKVFSFIQLYFDRQQHDDVTAVMQEVMQQLQTMAENEHSEELLLSFSDNIFVPMKTVDMPNHQVARFLGSDFADALGGLQPGQWQSGIRSGYGVHIVKLMTQSGGELQSLEQVRAQVKKQWLNVQRRQSLDKLYQGLFKEYQVKMNPG